MPRLTVKLLLTPVIVPALAVIVTPVAAVVTARLPLQKPDDSVTVAGAMITVPVVLVPVRLSGPLKVEMRRLLRSRASMEVAKTLFAICGVAMVAVNVK